MNSCDTAVSLPLAVTWAIRDGTYTRTRRRGHAQKLAEALSPLQEPWQDWVIKVVKHYRLNCTEARAMALAAIGAQQSREYHIILDDQELSVRYAMQILEAHGLLKCVNPGADPEREYTRYLIGPSVLSGEFAVDCCAI